jgi:hypothetical protein
MVGELGFQDRGTTKLGRKYRVTTPVPKDAWRVILANAQESLITQTPDWMSAIVSGGGWQDRSRLYDLDGGRQLLVALVGLGVGPATVLTSWSTGWGYGGNLSSDGLLTEGDAELIAGDLASHKTPRTPLAPSPYDRLRSSATHSATTRIDHLTHLLDLSMGKGPVRKGYKRDARRSILHAQRTNVQVDRQEGSKSLPAFYRLYKKSAMRWTRAADRPRTVGLIQQRVTERLHLLTALSGALSPVLRDGAHSLNFRAAMDRELAGPSHANALLHHCAIDEATAESARSYSFGDSDVGSSLAAYDASYGARPVTWSSYHWEHFPVAAASSAVREAYRGRMRWSARGFALDKR